MAVVPGERRDAGQHLGVRRRTFVVREDEIAAAALYVDSRAESVAGDHRAFDVPAGPSRTDR